MKDKRGRASKREEYGFLIKDKKGFELMTGTAVMIMLVILVVIFLIIFWDMETGIFSDFINNLFSKTNVDSLVTTCNSLVTQQAIYDYCCVEKEVKYKQEGKIVKEELTCRELAEKSFVAGRINKINCEGAC